MNEVTTQKSRMTFILLGLFLGVLGVHNFYAGYIGRGIGQVLISVFAILSVCVFLGMPFIIVEIWALIEICLVTKDATGQKFI